MRRLLALLFVAAFLILVAAAGIGAFAAVDLASARTDLQRAKAHTRAFRFEQARAALDAAERRLGSARSKLASFPLGTVALLPGVGDDVRATRALARGATEAVEGANRALDAARALPSREQFRVEAGRLPEIDWSTVRAQSLRASTSFEAAVDVVERGARGDLLGPIERAREQFLAEARTARDTARRLAAGAGVLGDLLGEQRVAHHLVVIQNGAERRATGGAIESFVLLRADRRALEIVRADPDEVIAQDDVDAAHRLNTIPDMDAVGVRIADAYAAATGVNADTIVMLDQAALRGLLAVTGPISVDARTLSADNAVEFLSRDVLDHYPVEPGQSRFLGRVTRTLASRLIDGFSVPDLVEQVARAAVGKHMQVWARDARAAEVMTTLGVSGQPPFDDEQTLTTMIVGNNPSPAEMDYYARRTLRYEVYLHAGGSGDVTARATLHNQVRRGQLPGVVLAKSGFGRLRQVLTLYLGSDEPVDEEEVRVPPGESVTHTFDVRRIESEQGRFSLRVVRQPSLFADRLEVVVHLPPGARAQARQGLRGDGRVLRFAGLLDRDRVVSVRYR